MGYDFTSSFIAGYERMSAFADLIDKINVFPVADGDTGTNLRFSLAGLRHLDRIERDDVISKLLLQARGNSGNIACSFFSGFLRADSMDDLAYHAAEGRNLAWKAVANPMEGTMLSVFDVLSSGLGKGVSLSDIECLLIDLKNTVKSTAQILPKLRAAGVIDSGSLGMFIYLETFFCILMGMPDKCSNIFELFQGNLRISHDFTEDDGEGYCIDMVLESVEDSKPDIQRFSGIGDAVVVIKQNNMLKIHLHSRQLDEVKKRSIGMGMLKSMSVDDLAAQIKDFKNINIKQAIHIMSDCAGSVARSYAKKLGISLLDSYINLDGRSLPESLYHPEDLYSSMRLGAKASTSQPSIRERHQCYQRSLDEHGRVLYLCAGSSFTNNFDVATQWKRDNDPDNKFIVIDTKSASGRLGLLAIETARFAAKSSDPEEVVVFAEKAIQSGIEYGFVDTLKYLAAGGRMPGAVAKLGDFLNKKPILEQTACGIRTVGYTSEKKEQLGFVLDKLQHYAADDALPSVMIQYSDNRSWVEDVAKKEIEGIHPQLNLIVQPLSLTSGVHLGPGTWGISILPYFES